MKKYLTILIVVIVVAALVVLALYLWKSGSLNSVVGGSSGNLPSGGNQGTNGSLNDNASGNNALNGGTNNSGGEAGVGTGSASGTPGAVAGSFGPLSPDPILNYFPTASGTIFAIETNGTIASITNGQTSYLSSSTADNIISGAFSHDGKKAFISFGDPNNPQTDVFDMASEKWNALPQGLLSPSWSPSDYRIAFLTNNGGIERLATLNANSPKTGPTSIFSFYATDLSMQWVGVNQFVFSDRPSIYAPGSMLFFDASKRTLLPLLVNAPGAMSTWGVAPGSTSAEGFVLSFPEGTGNGANQFITPSGNLIKNLDIQTLPSKCGFGMGMQISLVPASGATSSPVTAPTSSFSLYCGVPRDLNPVGLLHLPDDYNQMAAFSSDDIYQIDASTGEMNTLWNDSTQNVDVSVVKVLGSELYFIDRYTNKLFGITLSQ